MYLTVKQVLKHLTKEEYLSLKELSHIAKNLSNEAIYNVRQYYFNESEYLNYEKNYALLKDSDNYKMLNSNMQDQVWTLQNLSAKQEFLYTRKKTLTAAR